MVVIVLDELKELVSCATAIDPDTDEPGLAFRPLVNNLRQLVERFVRAIQTGADLDEGALLALLAEARDGIRPRTLSDHVLPRKLSPDPDIQRRHDDDWQRRYPDGNGFLVAFENLVRHLRYEYRIRDHQGECDCAVRTAVGGTAKPQCAELACFGGPCGTATDFVETYRCATCGRLWERSESYTSFGPNVGWSPLVESG